MDVLLLALPAVGLLVSWIWPEAWPFLAVAAAVSSVPTLLRAWRGFMNRRLTIEAFNTVALGVSFALQAWQSAAFIALMLGFARWLDDRTEARATRAIEELLALKPLRARRERDGKLEDIPSESVAVGDLLIVPNGERIPADGIVMSGTGFVNQASVTGESEAVEKVIGDPLFASTLVEAGSLKMRATAVGKDSTLERMANLVRDAERHKSKPERLADRFTAIFLPVVGLIGLGVWFWTHDPQKVASIFLVACADDMAVAIPLAITASLGQAARRGVVIKGGARLQALASADTLVLDKTGTLTYGTMRIERLDRDPGVSEAFIWECLAVGEKFTEHPIGKALFREAVKHVGATRDPEIFQPIAGKGVVARFNGHDLLIGTAELLRGRQISFDGAWLAGSTSPTEAAHADVFVGLDGVCVARVRVMDVPRPEAKESLEELRHLGMKRVIMFTGDTQRTAASIARTVGLEEFYPGMSPEQKWHEVGKLTAQGKVAMVGDGVNDAPALARADVGIAMGSGTAAAIESADIVILTDDLRRLPEAVSLSRRTIAVIHGDMWIWGITNLVGFGLVFAGLIGPALAALYNFLTDFLPLLNSARLFTGDGGQMKKKT